MGIQLNGSSGADIISSSDGTLTIDGTSTVSTPIVTNTITISDKISHTGDSNTHIRFAGDDTVTVETAGSEKLRITSAGNVNQTIYADAIGFNQTASGNHYIKNIVNANRTGANASILALHAHWNSKDVAAIKFRTGADTSNKDDGIICFETSSANNITERLRINNVGSVGIGTVSPSVKLHVYDGSIRSSNIGNTNFTELGSDGNIEIKRTGGSAYIDFADATSNDADCRIQHVTDGLEFSTGGQGSRTTKLRIASGDCASFGNASPPSWQTGGGYYNIQLANAGYFRADTDTSSNFLSYGVNAYRDSSGWKFIENGRATQISHGTGTDAIRFNVSNSGNANNAITFSEALKIEADGKITVGANGDIRFTNGSWTGEVAGKIQHNSNNLYIQGGTGGIRFRHHSSGVNQFSMTNGGNFEITNGDLVVASGHGIDFSATGNGGSSPTGVSELFNDYETGTFTVTLANSLSVHTQTKLTYTKIGNKCHISGQFRINTGGSDLTINNLPFTTVNTGGTDETFSVGTVGLYYVSMPSDGNASGEIYTKTQKNDNNIRFVYNRHNTDPNSHTATANGYYTISHWYTVST